MDILKPEIRKAELNHIDEIMKVLADARTFQRSQGFCQWEDGYPDVATVTTDILSGNARIFVDNEEILGYCLLAIGDESYDALGDIWHTRGEYGVIHRLALSSKSRGKKLTSHIFPMIEEEYRRMGITVIRVDTGDSNRIMQHILLRQGYHPLGLHTFTWGPRLAFEKQL